MMSPDRIHQIGIFTVGTLFFRNLIQLFALRSKLPTSGMDGKLTVLRTVLRGCFLYRHLLLRAVMRKPRLVPLAVTFAIYG